MDLDVKPQQNTLFLYRQKSKTFLLKLQNLAWNKGVPARFMKKMCIEMIYHEKSAKNYTILLQQNCVFFSVVYLFNDQNFV